MLYAEGVEDGSSSECQRDERGNWICEAQAGVGASPFWQSVDHWNFPEVVKYQTAPWGSFPEKRAYASPKESYCTECIGTPVGEVSLVPKTVIFAGAVTAVIAGLAWLISSKGS